MRFAATIRILFVLILALAFIDQHNSGILGSAFTKQEMAGHPSATGSFSSHELIDVHHGDDITSDMPELGITPEFILKNTIEFLVPAPVLANPSPFWQPPESRS